ncbi:MAG: nicotinate-nucleotide adenylyltransferase [Gemmatimonadaceae bacterium]
MRIGVFGGTFDPPHLGHLLAASDAYDALGFDQVLFIPAAGQPLKSVIVASPADRLAMVELLVAGDPRFAVDPIEIERGGLSFTVDTLRALHERWRSDGALALILLLGADAAATLPQWREPAELAALAEVIVLSRAGGGGTGATAGRAIDTRRVDVSSTEIRARVAAGKSIRGFVPEPVAAYIEGRRLYR